MLEDSLFASRPPARSKKPATLVLSVIVHSVLAGALIVIPLFQTQVLPQIPLFEPLHPPAAPVPKFRGVELVPAPRSVSVAKPPEVTALIAPQAIPNIIIKDVGDPPTIIGTNFIPGRPGSDTNGPGIPGGPELFGLPPRGGTPPLPPPSAPKPPPPQAVAEPAPTTLIRKGGDVVQSNLIYTVKPEYPRLAVASHTQGAVILEAVITREGTIDSSRLRVLTGNPLLTSAAVEAVKQWRYRPTTLNGAAVEVLTTITVNFSMN